MEGDTALLFWFFLMTQQRVAHLDIIGSCYNIHGQGVWSALTVEEKIRDTKNMMNELIHIASDKYAKVVLQHMARDMEKAIVDEAHEHTHVYKEYKTLFSIAQNIVQQLPQGTTEQIYISSYLDNALESIGKLFALRSNIYTLTAQYDTNNIGILCSYSDDSTMERLSTHVEYLLNREHEVYLFFTGYVVTLPLQWKQYYEEKGVHIYYYPLTEEYIEQVEENTCYLLRSMYECRLDKLYCSLVACDIVGSLCIQEGVARRIIFDATEAHSLVQGICASVIDAIVVTDKAYGHALAVSSFFTTKDILIRTHNDEELLSDVTHNREKNRKDVVDVVYK